MCTHPQLKAKSATHPTHCQSGLGVAVRDCRVDLVFYRPNKHRAFPQLRSLLDRHDLLDRQQSSFLAATSFRIAINY